MHLSSRSLSIIVALVVLYRMFPAQIDEYTFGTSDRGNRLNVHTPPVMIAMFGWVILLLEASIVFDPGWVMRFLYGS